MGLVGMSRRSQLRIVGIGGDSSGITVDPGSAIGVGPLTAVFTSLNNPALYCHLSPVILQAEDRGGGTVVFSEVARRGRATTPIPVDPGDPGPTAACSFMWRID